MNYTPEPWKVIAPIRGYEAGISTDTPGERPHSEITIADLPEVQGKGDPQANAARIVACVNACAGLTPLTPEGASVFRECVEALKLVLEMLNDGRLIRPIEKDGSKDYFLTAMNLVADVKSIQQAHAHAQGQRGIFVPSA